MSNMLTRNVIFPHYDKIYSNKTEALAAAEHDNVLVGRCVLIKYCDTAYDGDTKRAIMEVEPESSNSLRGDQKLFWEQYQIDGAMKDRLLLQKVAIKTESGYQLTYKEVCFLNYDANASPDMSWVESKIDEAIAEQDLITEEEIRTMISTAMEGITAGVYWNDEYLIN